MSPLNIKASHIVKPPLCSPIGISVSRVSSFREGRDVGGSCAGSVVGVVLRALGTEKCFFSDEDEGLPMRLNIIMKAD